MRNFIYSDMFCIENEACDNFALQEQSNNSIKLQPIDEKSFAVNFNIF